ncbi:MAG TPA: hypothetical protein VGC54_02575, partial [Planctomycetota bacterium]
MPLIRPLFLAAALCAATTPALAQDPGAADRAQQLRERIEDIQRQLDELLAQLGPESTGATASRITPGDLRMEWFREHERMVEATPYGDMNWQFLGPENISGRVTDLAAGTPRGKTYTLFAATASGGLWKTVNEGTTWRPVFENGPSNSIGAVALAPSDQETVWIGLGESNIFRSSMSGAGVYKSTDGGDNWEHMGLVDVGTVARIVIHPTDPDVVYVAAGGKEWADNPERGVYRTRNGGATWEPVLHVDERTGATDLRMDPTKPEILYAATWQRRRKLWNDPRSEPGFTGSGIHRSMDGGDTWTAIVDGLPDAEHRGRIGIDVARSNPNVVYAFVDNYQSQDGEPAIVDSYGRVQQGAIEGAQIYRSDDRGAHWRKTSESDNTMRRLGSTYGWVFGQIRVDPADEDTIYVMGLGLNVSNDAGASFRPLRGMHSDHHALWIDPQNSDYLINGNDGGLVISYDGGRRWRNFTDILPAVQFYNVAYDMAEPFHVYGSIQDHGSRRGVVDLSRGRDRIPATDWENAPGGEASYQAIDPTDPDTVYSAGFYG